MHLANVSMYDLFRNVKNALEHNSSSVTCLICKKMELQSVLTFGTIRLEPEISLQPLILIQEKHF